MSITPYEEPQALALTPAELMEEYRLAVETEGRFRMRHADVLNELELIVAEREEAKQAILGLMESRKLTNLEDEHHFISFSQPDRGHYDPDKLPESVRSRPGVVKRVADKDAIEKLLNRKRGGLTDEEREQVTAAWTENKIKPSLRITNKDGKNG